MSIKEDEEDIQLESIAPQWDTPGWFDKTLELEGLCPEIMTYSAHTPTDMMISNRKIRIGLIHLTLHTRSTPFNKGAMRVAAYARTTSSTTRLVAK